MRALGKGTYREVPGEHYGTPKELWGFRARVDATDPERAARTFADANASLLGLDGVGRLARRAIRQSLGAAHVILQQRYRGVPVHRGFVTVHIAHSGHVYLVKNRVVPAPLLGGEPEFELSEREARARAVKAARGKRRIAARVHSVEQRWFPKGKRLLPSYRVRVRVGPPREDFIVYVEAKTGTILSKYDNLSTAHPGRALVFDPNPVVALGDYRPLLGPRRHRTPPPECYRHVLLPRLATSGYLEGKHVSTKLTQPPTRRRDRAFLFQSGERGFTEAMAYFHVDRAIAHLESLGYTGSRRIFQRVIGVNVRASREDNSFFDPVEKSLFFGCGGVDDAEDGETILHELGHAIQDAICHDFGQSKESAAMGEGFGDYFAASFFADRKQGRYRAAVMSWDTIADGGDPPCLRRLDGKKTFTDFRPRGDEHDNGEIWSATLWDIHEALGREVADRIIIESHFQLDGFTTFDRGARAIVDADQNLWSGRHRDKLRAIFRRRRIRPV